MIRIVTRQRLTALANQIESLRAEVQQVRQAASVVLREKALAEQARDFYQHQAEQWERRASRFIDQAHLKAGNIDIPVMGDPAPPSPTPQRQVMRALNVTEINRSRPQEMPRPAAVLGVDDTAARSAVAGVLE